MGVDADVRGVSAHGGARAAGRGRRRRAVGRHRHPAAHLGAAEAGAAAGALRQALRLAPPQAPRVPARGRRPRRRRGSVNLKLNLLYSLHSSEIRTKTAA